MEEGEEQARSRANDALIDGKTKRLYKLLLYWKSRVNEVGESKKRAQ